MDSLALSFRAMFDPRLAARLTATYELVLTVAFRARVENGQIAPAARAGPPARLMRPSKPPQRATALVYDDG